jgi:protoporphyrinogen/coproporphyrinogen III oxidase
MSRVAVVGGGITGLSAARSLALRGVDVIVLEAGNRWGGKLAPVAMNGVHLDGGAESILARRPEGLQLIDELALGSRVVHPTETKPQLLVGGHLHAMPASLLGVPTDVSQLAGLLSAEGWRTAASEPERPAPAFDHDVAIGRYVDERFGAEVTDRLLEPLLGGVYAGYARRLSFDAVAHELFVRAKGGGSLLRHAQAIGQEGQDGPVFAGLRGGVSIMVDALVDDLDRRGVALRPGAAVRALDHMAGGYQLVIGAAGAPEMIMADGVLLTAPATATGRLLCGLVDSAQEFARLPYASVAVITLVVRRVRSDASGLLVPAGELPTIKALTYSSIKWPWVASQARRAWGSGVEIVRLSIGRHGEPTSLQVTDRALIDRTFSEALTIPGWETATLVHGAVNRWGGALPQYQVGHRDLVTQLRSEVAGRPGLAVAGAALDGVGIAACLGSAQAAVDALAADFGLGRDEMIKSEDQLEESGR